MGRLPVQSSVHTSYPVRQHRSQQNSKGRHSCHDIERQPETMRASADLLRQIATLQRVFGSFPVVQVASNETREEEGAQRTGDGKEVVNHAEVLEPKKLRGCGHHDGEVHAVA